VDKCGYLEKAGECKLLNNKYCEYKKEMRNSHCIHNKIVKFNNINI
jgi:hypothetical protein